MSSQFVVYPNLLGTWSSPPYSAAFSRDNPLYPNGRGEIIMKLVVYKQENNQLWASNYWKFVGDEKWHMEEATGYLLPDLSVKLVESNPTPDIGSSGLFTLVPNRLSKNNVANSYQVYYEGVGRGISFTTSLNYDSASTQDLTPIIKD